MQFDAAQRVRKTSTVPCGRPGLRRSVVVDWRLPFMVSHLVRIACFAIASNAVERALLSEAGDAELTAAAPVVEGKRGESAAADDARRAACVNETATTPLR
jgi:hypothetical protein